MSSVRKVSFRTQPSLSLKDYKSFTILSFSGTKVPLKIYYYKSFLSFEVIRNGQLPIGTLLSTIPGINIRSLPLPTGLKEIFQFQIDYFSLDTSSKQLVVTTQYPGTLSYFKDYLTITNPGLSVYAILKHPRKTDFAVNGAIRIGNGFYNTTISRDPLTNKYIVKGLFWNNSHFRLYTQILSSNITPGISEKAQKFHSIQHSQC